MKHLKVMRKLNPFFSPFMTWASCKAKLLSECKSKSTTHQISQKVFISLLTANVSSTSSCKGGNYPKLNLLQRRSLEQIDKYRYIPYSTLTDIPIPWSHTSSRQTQMCPTRCNPTLFDATTAVEKVKTHLAGGPVAARERYRKTYI